MVTPGVSRGTTIMLCCAWVGASGLERPITISTSQRLSRIPEVHHLRPLMTYSSPSRRIFVWMFVASDDATAGSVMAKAERILPSSSGSSHFFFRSSLA
jgi:hypothetical protein